MKSLQHRSHTSERLDQLDLAGPELERCLRELAVINRLLGNHRSIKQAVRACIKRFPKKKNWLIIDLGCGGGDVLRMIASLCKKEGISAQLIGYDGNANSLEIARSFEEEDSNITYRTADILSPDFVLPPCDLLISSHFLYHLPDQAFLDFIHTHQTNVRIAWIISELERNQIALTLFRIFSPLLGFSKLTRSDGLLAIKRAFSMPEIRLLLQRLNWEDTRLRKVWAFRFILTLFSPQSNSAY